MGDSLETIIASALSEEWGCSLDTMTEGVVAALRVALQADPELVTELGAIEVGLVTRWGGGIVEATVLRDLAQYPANGTSVFVFPAEEQT